MDGCGINYEEFIVGLFSLDHDATRKDIMEIMSEIKNHQMQNHNLEARLKTVEQKVQDLHLELGERMDLVIGFLKRPPDRYDSRPNKWERFK